MRGGNDPIAGLRIHPCELHARFALPEQTVGGIDMDVEIGSADVMLRDRDQLRQQDAQRHPVLGIMQVARERMEVPERGVRGIVKAARLRLAMPGSYWGMSPFRI